MHPVFTIGHSNHEFATFRALLTRHAVDAVADVRSVPYSRRYPQFAKRPLAEALDGAGVGYLWLGDALGGRQDAFAGIDDPAARYDRVAESTGFQAGLDRVLTEAGARRVALMCAEREPMQCHRALLVSRHLAVRGAEICHIHADGVLELQGDFESRLTDAAGTAPPPLFDDANSRAAALHDAYARAARGFPRR
jgi:uncharacterized protein (DUF488 family)